MLRSILKSYQKILTELADMKEVMHDLKKTVSKLKSSIQVQNTTRNDKNKALDAVQQREKVYVEKYEHSIEVSQCERSADRSIENVIRYKAYNVAPIKTQVQNNTKKSQLTTYTRQEPQHNPHLHGKIQRSEAFAPTFYDVDDRYSDCVNAYLSSRSDDRVTKSSPVKATKKSKTDVQNDTCNTQNKSKIIQTQENIGLQNTHTNKSIREKNKKSKINKVQKTSTMEIKNVSCLSNPADVSERRQVQNAKDMVQDKVNTTNATARNSTATPQAANIDETATSMPVKRRIRKLPTKNTQDVMQVNNANDTFVHNTKQKKISKASTKSDMVITEQKGNAEVLPNDSKSLINDTFLQEIEKEENKDE